MLIVLCVILGALDALLALKTRRLSAEVTDLRASSQASLSNALAAGQTVQPMVLLDHTGTPVPLSFEPGNGSVLLLISSGACEYCKEAEPIWTKVAGDLQSDRLRVIGLAIDTAPEELEHADLPFDLYTPGGDAVWLMSRIAGVPAAILINDQGVVVRAFYGEQFGLEEAVKAHLLAQSHPYGIDPEPGLHP